MTKYYTNDRKYLSPFKSDIAAGKENSALVIDASKAHFIDHNIQETLVDFLKTAPDDNITVEMHGFSEHQLPDPNSVTIAAH